MPYVNIKVTHEGTTPGSKGLTREQKAELISGATKLLVDVLNKKPSTTFVIIEEVELDNWGIGGLPAEAFRNAVKQKPGG